MKVIHKDASVTAPDDTFPGTFEAILSAPTKDRDGETLLPTEWKQPLPDHITVDMDHEMTVAGTIGSAKPWIDEKGNLRISGRFASTAKAQEVRTLMQEGHINRTSVAFMSEKTHKDGVSSVTREVLNAAVVAIPANREAVVLSAKGLKSGRRNSTADQTHLNEIARHAIALGAVIDTEGDLSMPVPAKSFTVKDAGDDPNAQVAAIDAALDEATSLLQGVDLTTLPAEVQQALALVTAAETVVDELMDALGIPDPDDDDDSEVDTPAPAPAKAATDADVKSAPVEADSIDQQVMAARKRYYYVNLNEGN